MKTVVVGGGIIGLTTALALLRHGHKNVTVLAASFDDLTSHAAGAIWMPFALPPGSDPNQIQKWCEESIKWLKDLHETCPEEVGVHYVEGVEVFSDNDPFITHPYWAHCVQNFRLLSAQEAAEVIPSGTHGYQLGTFIYNPTNMLSYLKKQIGLLGGSFETRSIHSLDEVDADVIINCSGIAAKDLVNDDKVYPMRGQTIKVYNPNIRRFRMAVDSNDHHTYVLPRPKGEVILGGTIQPYNGNTSSDDEDVKGIWERCCRLMPEVKDSKIITPVAGLRPGRVGGIRLEADSVRTAQGAHVIHNYGHGGSGHTLQWGCALNVVQLVNQYGSSRSKL